MSGIKFGSLFKDMLQGAKSTGASFTETGDTKGLGKAMEALNKLKEKAEDAAKALKEANQTLTEAESLYGKNSRAYSIALNTQKAAQLRVTKVASAEQFVKEKLSKQTEKIIEVQNKGVIGGRKYAKTFAEVNKSYEDNIKKILESKKLSEEQKNTELKNLKSKFMQDKLKAVFTDSENAMEEGMNVATGVIVDGIKFIAPELAPIMGLIEHTVIGAFKQIIELNDWLIKLQRSTSGMVTAARMGYDVFGNSATGMRSLNTAIIAANVSREDFSQAMNSLASNGFGQTIGAAQDLTKVQGDLSKYGLEASRAMKLYGAELGPSVRNLFQNFGKGIGEATEMLKDGADKARQLGLSAREFLKNFEAVTELVGDVYFQTTEQMREMATIATQLGVTVGTMAKGLIKMNGITELFSQQQRNAALGLDITARSLGKIYALRQQGKSGEAAKVEFAALAKDMQRAGFTNSKTGEVTQQGIATLSAAGVDKEAIAGIQKLALQAKRTGIEIGALGDTSQLSRLQQLKLAHDEAANITLEEQFKQIVGLVKQTFIDPLAAIFGPVLKAILNFGSFFVAFLQPIVAAGITILKFISGIDWLINIVEGIGDAFSWFTQGIEAIYKALDTYIITPVSTLLAPVFTFIANMFRGLGEVIGGVLVAMGIYAIAAWAMAPATVAAAVGLWAMVSPMLPVIAVIAAVGLVLWALWEGVKWVADKLGGFGKILDFLMIPLKVIWMGLKFLWDVISDYVIQPIKNVLGPVFDFLGDVINDLIAPFKWLWEQLQAFGDWLEKWFGSGKADSSAQNATDWTEELSKAQVGDINTSVPSASSSLGAMIAAPSKTIEESNINKNYIETGSNGTVKNNITIHTNVSGLVSNINTLKSAT